MTTTVSTRRTTPRHQNVNAGATNQYVRAGSADDTADALRDAAYDIAANGGRLPNVSDKAWATLEMMARKYDGSEDNTRELNEARSKLSELQKIIDVLNEALIHLPAEDAGAILALVFDTSGGIFGALSDIGDGLLDAAAAVGLGSGSTNEHGRIDLDIDDNIARSLAALMSGDGKAVQDKLLGKLDKNGDYKPSDVSLEKLQQTSEKLEALVHRLRGGLGETELASPNSMAVTVERFTSFDFINLGKKTPAASETAEQPAQHISTTELKSQIEAMQLWVDSLDNEDQRRRLSGLLARLPLLAGVVNEGLSLADQADRMAYVAMFMSGTGKPEFSGDNPELNAGNVGKMLAAVLAGDTDALKKFGEMNDKKLNEITSDFLKVEGEFRQARDIKEEEGKAAKEFYNNHVVPVASGAVAVEDSQENLDKENERQARARAAAA